MSSRQITNITCPKCQQEIQFELWDSVNVTFHPDFKEKVLTGELFQFKCQNCDLTAPVDYNFLYHDMTKKVMIHYIAQDQSADVEIETFEKTLANMKEKDSQTYEHLLETQHRFVKGRSDLIEKVQILSAGYDDRVIELMKETIRQTKKDLIDGYQDFIFGDDVNGDHYFFIVYDAEHINHLPFNYSQYEQLKEIYAPLFSDKDYVVNQDWAHVRVKL